MNQTLYTVGACSIYDKPSVTHKDTGGSVWLRCEDAAQYADHITVNGERVEGAVYEVIIGTSLRHWTMQEEDCGWLTLTRPARLGRKCVPDGLAYEINEGKEKK